MYTSSHGHGNAKYAPAGYPKTAMNIHPSHISPFHGAASPATLSTGLCHCFDDPANCLITCFCPCVTFGQIAEIVNKGSISCAASGAVYGLLAPTGLSCLYSCVYRSRLRGQYDLEEALIAWFISTVRLAHLVKNTKSSRTVDLIWGLVGKQTWIDKVEELQFLRS